MDRSTAQWALMVTLLLLGAAAIPGLPQTSQQLRLSKQISPAITLSPADLTPICAGIENPLGCYEKYYHGLTENKGTPYAFADLKARFKDDADAQSNCHPIAHVIGRVAAERYPTVAEAYREGDSFCWSGYYHGVLETFVARVGRERIANSLNGICSGMSPRDSGASIFDYYNCVHGLGHGLMAIQNDKLWDALALCGRLAGSWERQSCASGIFMENLIADGRNHKTEYLRPEEPLYPCTAAPDEYKEQCYLIQSSYIMKVADGDTVRAFDICRNTEAKFRATCDESLGRDISGRTISDTERTRVECFRGGTDEEKLHCVIGAAKDFVAYFHTDREALGLCGTLGDDGARSACRSTVSRYFALF